MRTMELDPATPMRAVDDSAFGAGPLACLFGGPGETDRTAPAGWRVVRWPSDPDPSTRRWLVDAWRGVVAE